VRMFFLRVFKRKIACWQRSITNVGLWRQRVRNVKRRVWRRLWDRNRAVSQNAVTSRCWRRARQVVERERAERWWRPDQR